MHGPGDDLDDTDDRLVARIAYDDNVAFRALVRRYYTPFLTYLAYTTGSRETAEDLLQELFFRLWVGRRTLPNDGNLRLYLYASARNAMLNHVRHHHRAERHTAAYVHDRDTNSGAHQDDPLVELERGELTQRVHNAIEQLPDRVREVFQLHREQGLTYQEIATLLGISTHTVKFHLGRATRALRAAVGPLLGLLVMSHR